MLNGASTGLDGLGAAWSEPDELLITITGAAPASDGADLPTIRPQPPSGGAGGLEATYQVFTPSSLVHVLPLRSVRCCCFVKYKLKHRNKLTRVEKQNRADRK